MHQSNEEHAIAEALEGTLVAELASAVDARLEALDLSQAAVWLSGYIVGRLARDSKGLSVAAYEHPLQISLLDSLDGDLIDRLITRRQGG